MLIPPSLEIVLLVAGVNVEHINDLKVTFEGTGTTMFDKKLVVSGREAGTSTKGLWFLAALEATVYDEHMSSWLQ